MIQPQPIHLSFTYRQEDSVQKGVSQAASPVRRWWDQWAKWLAWQAVIGLAVTLFVVLGTNHEQSGFDWSWSGLRHTLATIACYWLLGMGVLALVMLLGSLRRKDAKPASSDLEPHTVTIDTEELQWKRPGIRVAYEWTYFKRFDEDAQWFYLTLLTSQLLYLPKRTMTPDQIVYLRALLQARIGKTQAFEVVSPTNPRTTPTP